MMLDIISSDYRFISSIEEKVNMKSEAIANSNNLESI